jgi:hypothetical protein
VLAIKKREYDPETKKTFVENWRSTIWASRYRAGIKQRHLCEVKEGISKPIRLRFGTLWSARCCWKLRRIKNKV